MRTVPRLLNYQLSRPSTINLSAGVAQQRQQQFRKLPGNPPHGSASLPVGPRFQVKGAECKEKNGDLA